MSIFSEWNINVILRNEIKKNQERISELENMLSIIERNSDKQTVNLSLAKEILGKENEIDLLKKKADELKERSDKLIELSKEESSEFASISFSILNC